MKRLLVIAMLLSLESTAARADWNGAQWGQSLSEVQAIFTDGQILEAFRDKAGSVYGRPLLLTDYDAPHTDGKAALFFRKVDDTEVLTTVSLVVDPTENAVADMKSLLEDRYGAPFVNSVSPVDGCQSHSTKWRDEDRGNLVTLKVRQCEYSFQAYVWYSPLELANETGL